MSDKNQELVQSQRKVEQESVPKPVEKKEPGKASKASGNEPGKASKTSGNGKEGKQGKEKKAIKSKKSLIRVSPRTVKTKKRKALISPGKRIRKGRYDFKPFVCALCNAGFKYEQVLVFHVRSHTGEKPYECGQCDFAAIQPASLEQHRRVAHKLDGYQCSHCGKAFRKEATLKMHCRSHESDAKGASNAENVTKKERLLETKSDQAKSASPGCTHSDDVKEKTKKVKKSAPVVETETSKDGHEHVGNVKKDNSHVCDVCSFTCSKRGAYKKHMKQEHGVDIGGSKESSKPEKQPQSVRETPATENIQSGKATATSKDDRAAVDQAIKFVNQLKARTDDQGNNYWSCLKCTFVRFTQRTAFVHHLVSCQHRVVYSCDSCDYIAVKVTELQEHKEKEHRPPPEPSPKPSNLQFVYGCEVCGFVTAAIGGLAEHRFLKHGLPKATCTEFGFQEKAVFICEFCKYITTSYQEYSTHKQMAHPGMIAHYGPPMLTQQAQFQTFANPVVEVTKLRIAEDALVKQKKTKDAKIDRKSNNQEKITKTEQKVVQAEAVEGVNRQNLAVPQITEPKKPGDKLDKMKSVIQWSKRCQNCQMLLNSAFDMAHHKREIKDNWYNCRCHVCKYAATSLCDLECHKQQYHRHVCKMCDATCTSEADLINHTRLVHPLIFKHKYGHLTPLPEIQDQTTSSLKKHTTPVKTNQPKRKVESNWHVCKMCDLVCKSEVELVTHTRLVHPVIFDRSYMYTTYAGSGQPVTKTQTENTTQIPRLDSKIVKKGNQGEVEKKLVSQTSNSSQSTENVRADFIDLTKPTKLKPAYPKQKRTVDRLLERESDTDMSSEDETDVEEEEKLMKMLEDEDNECSSENGSNDDDESDSTDETSSFGQQPVSSGKLPNIHHTNVTMAPLPKAPVLGPNVQHLKRKLPVIPGMRLYSSLDLPLFPEDMKSFEERKKMPFALVPVEDIQNLTKDFITRTHAATLSFFIDTAMLVHAKSLLRRRKRWTYYSLPNIRLDTSSSEVVSVGAWDSRKRKKLEQRKHTEMKGNEVTEVKGNNATQVTDILELKTQAEKQLAILQKTVQPSASHASNPQRTDVPTDKNMLDRSIGVTLDMIRKIQQLVRDGTLTQQLSREIAPHCQVICNPYASLHDKLQHVEIINFVITKRTGIGLNELTGKVKSPKPWKFHDMSSPVRHNRSSKPDAKKSPASKQDKSVQNTKDETHSKKKINSSPDQLEQSSKSTSDKGAKLSRSANNSDGRQKTVQEGSVCNKSDASCFNKSSDLQQKKEKLLPNRGKARSESREESKGKNNGCDKKESKSEDARNLSLYVYQERKSKRAAEEKLKEGSKNVKTPGKKTETSSRHRVKSEREGSKTVDCREESSDSEEEKIGGRNRRCGGARDSNQCNKSVNGSRKTGSLRIDKSSGKSDRQGDKSDSNSDGRGDWPEIRITRSGMKVIHKGGGPSHSPVGGNKKREHSGSGGSVKKEEEVRKRESVSKKRKYNRNVEDPDDDGSSSEDDQPVRRQTRSAAVTPIGGKKVLKSTSKDKHTGDSSSTDGDKRSNDKGIGRSGDKTGLRNEKSVYRGVKTSLKEVQVSKTNDDVSESEEGDDEPKQRTTRSSLRNRTRIKTGAAEKNCKDCRKDVSVEMSAQRELRSRPQSTDVGRRLADRDSRSQTKLKLSPQTTDRVSRSSANSRKDAPAKIKKRDTPEGGHTPTGRTISPRQDRKRQSSKDDNHGDVSPKRARLTRSNVSYKI